MQNLVINIGHIADEGDVIAALDEPAAQDIEVNARANMANMWWRLNCGTTEIDTHFTGFNRSKWGGGSRQGVV
jgi:hypothetical protein